MCPHIQCDHSEPPPSWLGDPSIRLCQGSVSGTSSPSFLARHQSPSKGSPPPPITSLEKAKLRKHPPRSGGQHSGPHLTPEHFPKSERLVLDRGTGSQLPHTHQGCPEFGSKAGSPRQAPPVFLPHHEKQQCHHMRSLLEETHFPPTMSRCHTDLVHHL